MSSSPTVAMMWVLIQYIGRRRAQFRYARRTYLRRPWSHLLLRPSRYVVVSVTSVLAHIICCQAVKRARSDPIEISDDEPVTSRRKVEEVTFFKAEPLEPEIGILMDDTWRKDTPEDPVALE